MKKAILFCTLLVATMSASAKQNHMQAKPFSTQNKTIKVFSTYRAGHTPMEYKATLKFEAKEQPNEKEIVVFVNPDKRYQTLLGIGGAITDASAETFAQMSANQQSQFMAAYYDKYQGIGYSLLRTTIQSSDFANAPYSYLKDNDSSLTSFTIDHDRQYRIPMIKKALLSAGGTITTYASPWSPPAWMKSNKSMLQGGKLLPRFYATWANCFVKFIHAYEKEGIPIWGITVQNEPMAV